MFNLSEAAAVIVPRRELVRKAGRQYSEIGRIDMKLPAKIGSPMIPEDDYARLVNGQA